MTVFQFIRSNYLANSPTLNETHQWREQVLSAILFFVVVLGGATAIPSIVLAISENLWSVVVVDIFALAWVATIWRLPFLTFEQRAWNFLLLIYLLGVWFVIKVGLTGLIYLMALPVLTSLLLNIRRSMQALLLAAISLLLVGYLANTDLRVYGFDSHPFLQLAVVTINFVFIAAVISISCGVLLQRLDRSLERQRIITASLQQGQASLKVANEELRLIVAAVARLNDIVMIIQVDADAVGKHRLKLVFVNDAFVRQTGYQSKDVIGKSPIFLKGPSTQEDEMGRLNHALAVCEAVHIELICYTHDGSEFWMEADVVPLADNAGEYTHWVATGRDISERKKSQEHIHKLAYYDVLTGLPNRRLLLDRMSILLATARRSNMVSAVLFIDLDHFKYINDARGHAVGDALLMQVSQRLSSSLREVDTVAHIGGDEFVVLLCHISTDVVSGAHAAQAVAEKIRYSISQFFDIDGLQYSTTCSIGLTLLPRENQSPHDLLREADTAMYRAKNSGRNQIAFYETGMQTEVEQRLTMEREMAEAISDGQLQMVIQAQVDRLGRPVGGEMLMRWNHPERGPISPALFIPVAEESGMILRLGDWVMEQGCQALLQLQAAGFDLSLSVNVSPKQFRQSDFVGKVRRVLKYTGAPANRLIFEVTEGLLIDNLQDTIERMLELTTLGIRFSIDDFGTGYSSLAYLKRLPLYELKIDKSFVQDTPDDANDTAIVQSILSMASHLGLRVVAEGVETREQAEFLIANGCASMQGFLFARPMPLEQWIFLQKQIANPVRESSKVC